MTLSNLNAKHCAAFIAIFSSSLLFSQPGLQWAKQVPGPAYDLSHALALDSKGNIYTTGSFKETNDFDPGNGNYSATSAGLGDIFLSKSDPAGNFLWTKTTGGETMDVARAIAVDSDDNVVIGGCFENTIDLDPGTAAFTLGKMGDQNVFITKLNEAGDFIWGKNIGSPEVITCNNLKTDNKGNIYFTGSFRNQIDLPDGVKPLKANGFMRDMYIIKMNSAGDFLWTCSFAVNSNDVGKAFDVDASGNVYITGSFYNLETVDFDPSAGSHLKTPLSPEDVFILKLNTNGQLVWVNLMSGNFYDSKTCIALDEQEGIYLAGNFQKTVDADPGAGSFLLTSPGSGTDAFVTKFTASGTFVWAKQFGGVENEQVQTLAISKQGDVIFSGMYKGTVDFNPGSAEHILTSNGDYDIFICRLDKNGAFLCAGSIGGDGSDRPAVSVLDANDNLFVSGSFAGTADMDPGAGTFNMAATSGENVFLCKLGQCGVITSIDKQKNEKVLSIYPNPSSGKFKFINNSSGDDVLTEVRIINILGAEIYSSELTSGENEFNLTGQARGVYFIYLTRKDQEEPLIKKIILQ